MKKILHAKSPSLFVSVTMNILCHSKVINDSTQSAIKVSFTVNHFKRCGWHFKCRETITFVTNSWEIGERSIAKWSRAFRLTSIPDDQLEETRCIMIWFWSNFAVSNRVCSFIVMNMTTTDIYCYYQSTIISIFLTWGIYPHYISIIYPLFLPKFGYFGRDHFWWWPLWWYSPCCLQSNT